MRIMRRVQPKVGMFSHLCAESRSSKIGLSRCLRQLFCVRLIQLGAAVSEGKGVGFTGGASVSMRVRMEMGMSVKASLS